MIVQNNSVGIYSPLISSDIGLKKKDAIFCIDIKTSDIIENKNDYKKIIAESNQISLVSTGNEAVPTSENLQTYDEKLAVLTYIIKIKYVNDDKSFS